MSAEHLEEWHLATWYLAVLHDQPVLYVLDSDGEPWFSRADVVQSASEQEPTVNTFTPAGEPVVRFVVINGQTYFLADDVCDALGSPR